MIAGVKERKRRLRPPQRKDLERQRGKGKEESEKSPGVSSKRLGKEPLPHLAGSSGPEKKTSSGCHDDRGKRGRPSPIASEERKDGGSERLAAGKGGGSKTFQIYLHAAGKKILGKGTRIEGEGNRGECGERRGENEPSYSVARPQ